MHKNHNIQRSLLRMLTLLLALLPAGVWGQTDPYEGTWYITNTNQTNQTNNYYLCPATGYYLGYIDKPYITTYKTGPDINSVWTIEKVEVGGDTYYRILHNATGKYITAHEAVSGFDPAYLRLHLEYSDTPSDATLFIIVTHTNNKIAIRSKDYDDAANGHYWLDITQGNKSNYWLDNGQGQLGFWYNNPIDNNSAAPWRLEAATFKCGEPTFHFASGQLTITSPIAGATIYYAVGTSEPAINESNRYTGPIPLSEGSSTITAIVVRKSDGSDKSDPATFTMEVVSDGSQITNMNGFYTLAAGFTPSSTPIGTAEAPFRGIIDGGLNTISGLSHPLFGYVEDATIRNVILDNVSISSGNTEGDAAAIACKASGTTRIYNCGILATGSIVDTTSDGYTQITTNSSTISGSHYVGGLVGLLDGEARVVNCFSYADITGGNTVGGIVGYNNVATTSSNLKTMVFNCMFYGDINATATTNRAPIYNGTNIVNKDANGVSNYNFCRAEASYVTNRQITTANCALLAETRFLQRFEFFRHLLNGHRELAAWWITGDAADTSLVAKWVMEPSKIGSSTPYPILKPWGCYPSVVNYDAANAQENQPRNKGGKLGTLAVTIQMGSGGAQFAPPTSATITNPDTILIVTDKDPGHFNFNYAKVQLPYYNDVGTNNYNDYRVVTGWKIVSITGGTPGSFTTGEDAPAYNFADRQCTNKDLYSVSGRVFNQGAYWDVPEGVTAITIEPYWAKAAYCADNYRDIVYNTAMSTANTVPNVGGGQMFSNSNSLTINGQSQKVYSSIGNAIATTALNPNSSHTVYDYAVVLVGNYHQYKNVEGGNKPYTVMSADVNGDNEPDYSFMFRFDGRTPFHPVRYDFLNLIGLGMAQKSTDGTGSYNFGIMQPKYWFEVTNTALFRVTQFEYDRSDKAASPVIIEGGVIEQWVSGQSNGVSRKTTYFHVGSNVWFKEFHMGCHQDNDYYSKHVPISVTGGDYNLFYLTGAYKADVTVNNDNAECYINGGRFGTVAGTGMEGLGTDATKGDITWQIANADISEFYGGGINAAKPASGSISTSITDSHIDLFCGGPKFGDMGVGKTVTTTATNCTFGTFYGAGFGGNSYSRKAPKNETGGTNKVSWNTWVGKQYTQSWDGSFGGVSTQFDYQFLPQSGNTENVYRIFIEYVKFSLATCHTVTSTLTGCTVTGNFYGGGSLGKVDGVVTSTLTDCTLQGNAFGAGYSASLPTVEVDSIGFRVEPYYYEDFGTYRTGVWGATTTYTWQHANTVNSTNTAIDKNSHILYTIENLNDLGTVKGNVTLTINGGSVGGNVFGGGDESAVTGSGSTTVILSDNATITGNVYGGGNKGAVGGTSEVKIQDPQ